MQFAQLRNDKFMPNCQPHQTEKNLKNPLDKRGRKCYNMRAVNETAAVNETGDRERLTDRTARQDITKKIEKTFKKPLDKIKKM